MDPPSFTSSARIFATSIGERRWFLGASTEWPGVEPADVELGNVDVLTTEYPKVAVEIRSFPVPTKR